MEIVVVLVPLMLMLVTGGVILFNWAVKNGQYDDLEGPAHRILYDDDKELIPEDAITGLKKPVAAPVTRKMGRKQTLKLIQTQTQIHRNPMQLPTNRAIVAPDGGRTLP